MCLCKEIETTNRTEKPRDLFKKIRDTKGTFQAKMGTMKDRNGMDLTETEEEVARIHRVQFSSVTQSCLTLCNPKNHSMPGLLVYHQLSGFTQTHVH